VEPPLTEWLREAYELAGEKAAARRVNPHRAV
jgi:hypothetical protein